MDRGTNEGNGHSDTKTRPKMTRRTLQWRPRAYKRSRGRPNTRWWDDIQRGGGVQWMTQATDRKRGNDLGKAYILQWMETGYS
ncbi:hypothetical protein ILUMI_15711 [Ignelater luminosus]|uniref:Uncharacterized protein n=1 Tax=Ignelater luminosus TaxID=2038154 RepID=A0A8K0CSD0_IGNLU|nr:hypothetical protein ILUMI_15711 [Ignelater luminosus]